MTLAEVAQQAGVSITTASKVFNGHPSVRPYLRERVLGVATAMNYRPNQLARGLRSRFANLVSLGIQQLANPFFGTMTEALSSQLMGQGLGAIVCQNIDRVNEINHASRACGTILVSPGRRHIEEVVQERALVTITADPALLELAPNVAIDFMHPYQDVTRMLLAAGRRRIGFVCESEGSWAVDRRSKFQHVERVLAEAGLRPVGPRLGSFVGTAQLVAWLRDGGEPLDAVFCDNDIIASHVVHELWQQGIDPIADVRVIGCDGTWPLAGMWTIAIDIPAIATAAIKLLRAQLDQEEHPSEVCIRPKLQTTEQE